MFGGASAVNDARLNTTGQQMDGGFGTVEEYVESLNTRAEVQVEPHKPLKWYARSADLVFKQVDYKRHFVESL